MLAKNHFLYNAYDIAKNIGGKDFEFHRYNGDARTCHRGIVAFSFFFKDLKIACFQELGKIVFRKEFDCEKLTA